MSNDFAATTLQAAMANSRAGVQSQVTAWNEALQTDYLTVFNNWATSVLAGRSDNSNPPIATQCLRSWVLYGSRRIRWRNGPIR